MRFPDGNGASRMTTQRWRHPLAHWFCFTLGGECQVIPPAGGCALQKSTGLFADRLRQGKALSDRLPAAAALQKSTGLFADRLRE